MHDKFCPRARHVMNACVCEELSAARAEERRLAAQRVSDLYLTGDYEHGMMVRAALGEE